MLIMVNGIEIESTTTGCTRVLKDNLLFLYISIGSLEQQLSELI